MTNTRFFKTVLVTGGAGYVGSALVPALLDAGYTVRVLDLCIYGEDVFEDDTGHANLSLLKGDIRDRALLERALDGVDAVIHLACISNDPSFELNPDLGKSINYDAFGPLVDLSLAAGVKRFIYASSSSVYGIKSEPHVTEDLPLSPLTDYSKFKAMCEDDLFEKAGDAMTALVVRPATVCGYAPRLRLDLTVNILTNHAINKRKITVFGGAQMRPNIHIKDMVRFYLASLTWPSDVIHGKTYNVGYENFTVNDIARKVQSKIGDDVEIETTPTSDNRSYHISSQLIKDELGFTATHRLEDAISDLKSAFDAGKVPDSMHNPIYFNIKQMQTIQLS